MAWLKKKLAKEQPKRYIPHCKEQFYGIECIITDGCGNWFSMTQPKDH